MAWREFVCRTGKRKNAAPGRSACNNWVTRPASSSAQARALGSSRIYVEGDPEKLAKVKATLPDARFTTYAHPAKEAFVPKAHDPAPVDQEARPQGGPTRWFVETKRKFEAALPKMRQKAEAGGIWIIRPKTTNISKPDINGNIVQETALTAGLVDFKIGAVDETWSGMRFAVRR